MKLGNYSPEMLPRRIPFRANQSAALLFAALLPLLLAGFGCRDSYQQPQGTNTRNIRKIILSAMQGNSGDNAALSELFDLETTTAISFNKLEVDSIITGEKKKFFTVLLEYPNPYFNRFAVYDSMLHLIIMDRSLNGNLRLTAEPTGKNVRFKILEEFRSKDSIHLKRLSVYQQHADSVDMVFRTFIEYRQGNNIYTQNIQYMSDKMVVTSISADKKSGLRVFDDRFEYLAELARYVSKEMVFDSFIQEKIKKFPFKYSQMQITDKSSALRSIGIQTGVDSVHEYNNDKNNTDGYSVFLPEGWSVQRNVFVSFQLKRTLKGNLYTNSKLGARFAVIGIGENDVAENFINYNLEKVVKKFYTVRFSENITIGKNYYRFFELGCVNRKFLVVFEIPMFSYSQNASMYTEIINSFAIDC